MIQFVLLIVIVLSISVAVFAYLKLYLPSQKPECTDDVILSIDQSICEDSRLIITLENRGRFTSHGVFVRIGDPNRILRVHINKDRGDFDNLEPGESRTASYSYSEIGEKELEIQPLRFIDGTPALCENSVVTKNIECVETTPAPGFT